MIRSDIPITIVHEDPKGEMKDGLEEYSAKVETIYDIMSSKSGTRSWYKRELSINGKCTVTWEGIKDGKVVKGEA